MSLLASADRLFRANARRLHVLFSIKMQNTCINSVDAIDLRFLDIKNGIKILVSTVIATCLRFRSLNFKATELQRFNRKPAASKRVPHFHTVNIMYISTVGSVSKFSSGIQGLFSRNRHSMTRSRVSGKRESLRARRHMMFNIPSIALTQELRFDTRPCGVV